MNVTLSIYGKAYHDIIDVQNNGLFKKEENQPYYIRHAYKNLY